ncbi:MAG: BlaI/MecI/CopY family transcriptional regulator [Deltaproteobacteria bacterium]|nr:BlaI/MecI/CopY family transcriptional regulator [Deltaproteobacteria bacterium]
MNSPLPLLGVLEAAVLEHLWEVGSAIPRDVHGAVGEPRGITVNTVQSALERLHRKRVLIRERLGPAYRYAPALRREEFRARRIADALGPLDGTDARSVLEALVELVARGPAGRRNIDHLEELCREARDPSARRKRA